MSGARIGLIWAEAEGGVIGKDGVMPWHIPEDLAHFKRITLGSPVIMGRKTWDSLPARFRPLQDRRNIVVTRQHDWSADGVETVHSVDAALELAASGLSTDAASDLFADTSGHPSVDAASGGFAWVLGGAEIFNAVIDRADRLEVTQIRARFDGDTVAPTIDTRWKVVAEVTEPGVVLASVDRVDPVDPLDPVDPVDHSDPPWRTSRSGLEYRFLRYEAR